MSDETYLQAALKAVSGEKPDSYGRPLPNFLRTCIKDNVDDAGRRLPGDYITPLDIAIKMINLKTAREIHTHKDDNFVDIIGYSATVDDMHRHMRELGYDNGIMAFKSMDVGDMFKLLLIVTDEDDVYSELRKTFLPKSQFEQDLMIGIIPNEETKLKSHPVDDIELFDLLKGKEVWDNDTPMRRTSYIDDFESDYD